MTRPENETPLTAPEGYTVTRQEPFGGGQVTWVLTRDADGTGLGAYANQAGIDRACAYDITHNQAVVEQNRIVRDAIEAPPQTAADGGPVTPEVPAWQEPEPPAPQDPEPQVVEGVEPEPTTSG